MQNNHSIHSRNGSRGAVLVMSMLFLLLMAMIAGTVMEVSIQQFQMAGNEQFREEAFQRAQSISEEIASHQENFPLSGSIGYTLCDASDTDPDCNGTEFIKALTKNTVPSGIDLSYQIERQGPETLGNLPFRQAESQVSSSPAFDVSLFEVSTTVDGTTNRLGRASVVYGIARLVASSAQ